MNANRHNPRPNHRRHRPRESPRPNGAIPRNNGWLHAFRAEYPEYWQSANPCENAAIAGNRVYQPFANAQSCAGLARRKAQIWIFHHRYFAIYLYRANTSAPESPAAVRCQVWRLLLGFPAIPTAFQSQCKCDVPSAAQSGRGANIHGLCNRCR